ncbi:YbaB/EbfC family nucleoid-associated protein [Phytomonospora sp. NPDC050363]|uniref:YbaB/EbfC family nucleoid-associated protein n=1 Tax=Phytomonospora sp. NPDC050363 TaxID=3155642 RepID=UPI0033F238FB
MTNPFGGERAADPDAVLAKLERLQEQTEKLLKGFEDALGGMEDRGAEALSDDGMVRVVLDDAGGLEKIEISDAALRSLGRLNHSIMQAIRQAKVVHSAKMVELVERLGDADPFGLVAKMRGQMPGDVNETLRARQDERRRGY